MTIRTEIVRVVATYFSGQQRPFSVLAYGKDGYIYESDFARLMQARCCGTWRSRTVRYEECGVRYLEEAWSGAGLLAVLDDGDRIRRWDTGR